VTRSVTQEPASAAACARGCKRMKKDCTADNWVPRRGTLEGKLSGPPFPWYLMARQICSCKVPFSTGRPQSLFSRIFFTFPFFLFCYLAPSRLQPSLFSLVSFSAALVHSFSPSARQRRCLQRPVARALSHLTPCYNRQRPDLGTAIVWVACSHQASCARGPRSLQSKSQPLSNQELETHLLFFPFQSHLVPSLLLVVLLRNYDYDFTTLLFT
jgi:hypothetical protein